MTETAADTLSEILTTAEDRLWAHFKDAGAFQNTGDKGDSREDAIVRFLRERLPQRFEVVKGEVIDMGGKRSGQVDILIYDASTTVPLLADSTNCLMAVESVLATIEVKSKLDNSETEKAVKGVGKLRKLRPWGSRWGLARMNGAAADDGLPRLFTTIFAYDTDLVESTWVNNELDRIRRVCLSEQVSNQHIDRVVVLTRGMILPSDGRVATTEEDHRILGMWYFSLMGFLTREIVRRQPFPWADYESNDSRSWIKAATPLRDAPIPKKSGTVAIRRYKKQRG